MFKPCWPIVHTLLPDLSEQWIRATGSTLPPAKTLIFQEDVDFHFVYPHPWLSLPRNIRPRYLDNKSNGNDNNNNNNNRPVRRHFTLLPSSLYSTPPQAVFSCSSNNFVLQIICLELSCNSRIFHSHAPHDHRLHFSRESFTAFPTD